jgi:hypothetical protein
VLRRELHGATVHLWLRGTEFPSLVEFLEAMKAEFLPRSVHLE